MALKETLEKTLVSAQMQSDETRANARKEAELILRDASLKSRQIVNDSYGETQRVQQALVQLKHLEEDFRFKFRSLLEAHLKLVEQAPIAVVAPEAPRVAPPAVLFTEEDAVGAVAEVADSPRPEAKARCRFCRNRHRSQTWRLSSRPWRLRYQRRKPSPKKR